MIDSQLQIIDQRNYPTACNVVCAECESLSHHYMEDWDEESGEPIVTCKHCDWHAELIDAYDFLFEVVDIIESEGK